MASTRDHYTYRGGPRMTVHSLTVQQTPTGYTHQWLRHLMIYAMMFGGSAPLLEEADLHTYTFMQEDG